METQTLLGALQSKADPQVKAWWENYIKDSAPFRGVKMPVIRETLHTWYREYDIGARKNPGEQIELALALFHSPYTEDKLAGTLFLQEILLPGGYIDWQSDLPSFAALFHKGRIYDWNACDWFCVKLLGPLIEQQGLACARAIADWRDAENLWQARASVVAFVPVSGQAIYHLLIEQACSRLIERPERFAKTAVGWILRDISRIDEAFVRNFLNTRLENFSTESLNNAVKYFPQTDIRAYRQRLKGGGRGKAVEPRLPN
jgi:3-methyladenine DNA glycosylase AlkD